MTERGRRELQRQRHALAIGPSSARWNGSALVFDIDEVAVPIPRRLRGQVRVMFEAPCEHVTALDAGGAHRWGPIAPCARVEVDLASPAQRWSGHGYLDCNEGDEPIDRPFLAWDWSRAALRDGGCAVLYDVRHRSAPGNVERRGRGRSSEVLALRFDRHGRVEPFAAPPRRELPRSLWRLARSTRCDDDGSGFEPRVLQRLEDGPFYSRELIASRLLGEEVLAVHESLDVTRLLATSTQWMLPWRMPRRAG
ncbi:MAG TPA: carotenoid 1,2-hydratase [Methylibium sp.]|uniref:carotenoid 1,2-hydratase n=1 Tax=Methylibium sp. TaxID=2067992 RepID=UPI002DBA9E4C|nr:carotenoid 1,2-hydratase [Methylibium sp.]HEU4457685.1 carotenoid 1,2-hydratase [Methylibium sp.]